MIASRRWPRPDSAFDPLAFAVGAAMGDGVGHPLEHDRRDRLPGQIEEAGDAAHQGR